MPRAPRVFLLRGPGHRSVLKLVIPTLAWEEALHPRAHRQEMVRQNSAVELEIAIDDPAAEDVRSLLAIHLDVARGSTPAEFSFALDAEQLTNAGVTFFSARNRGRLVAVAALKRIDDTHAELKSMHTREADRGRGAGRALVEHILAFAAQQGYRRVSLETGKSDEFLSARVLYARCGFDPCGPFGGYSTSPYNTFMTIRIEPEGVEEMPKGNGAPGPTPA